jgi:hypothetical protein
MDLDADARRRAIPGPRRASRESRKRACWPPSGRPGLRVRVAIGMRGAPSPDPPYECHYRPMPGQRWPNQQGILFPGATPRDPGKAPGIVAPEAWRLEPFRCPCKYATSLLPTFFEALRRLMDAGPCAYCTAFIMSKIGRYMATTMPPTITPSTTIITGSISESSEETATSTSSS